jgi:hypothetical protein
MYFALSDGKLSILEKTSDLLIGMEMAKITSQITN